MKHKNSTGILFHLASVGIILTTFSSCLIPVNSLFETARPLGKGDIEIAGSVTKYSTFDDGSNINFGIRAGIGVTNKMDLKFKYEYMGGRYLMEDGKSKYAQVGNYLSLIPKFSMGKKEKWSISVPLSMYSTTDGDPDESLQYFTLAPTFLFTQTLKAQKIDLTFGLRNEIFLTEGYGWITGLTIGSGFSSDLNKWAIRPEVGFMLFDAPVINYGIGATIKLYRPKKADKASNLY